MFETIRYFKPAEFGCPCEECKRVIPESLVNYIEETARRLEILRSFLRKPIHVNSGIRCAAYNEKIGGVSDSFHKKGMAADIEVTGLSRDRLYGFVEGLIAAGRLPDGGIGRYRQFEHMIHFDCGPPARWER